jgi:hypothetical protein
MAGIARNIGLSGRRLRLLMGGVFLAAGVIGAAVLLAGGLPRGARLALFLPFYAGAIGVLQFRDHT